MKTIIRSQPSREWNPTSNSAFTRIEHSCFRWHMARGRSAGFLLATFLALQFFSLASTCLAQPIPRSAAYGGSALGMGSSFSLAAAEEDSADTAPAKTSIPCSQLGAKAGPDHKGDGLAVIPTAEGARLRCVFQRLEGVARREGLWVTSTVNNAVNDCFRFV